MVHVTHQDAKAFADWLGHDLPTEAQWEYAARGGLDKAVYAWGNEFLVGGRHQANTWQGVFPVTNAQEDMFPGSAPVGCFPANGYGLYDMIGNVWEWVDDWYYPVYGTQGTGGHDPRQPGMPVKVIKAAPTCARKIIAGATGPRPGTRRKPPWAPRTSVFELSKT